MRAGIFKTADGSDISPAEVIKRHRRNMILHSYMYYQLADTLWDDHKWQEVATELAELQEAFPEPIGYFDKEFENWDGSTGYHLPITERVGKGSKVTVTNAWIHEDCMYLLRLGELIAADKKAKGLI